MEFDLPLLENAWKVTEPIASFWAQLNARFSSFVEKTTAEDNPGKSSLLSFLGGLKTVEKVLVPSSSYVENSEKAYKLLSELSENCLPKFLLLYERFKFFTCAQSVSECACQFLGRFKHQYNLGCFRDLSGLSFKQQFLNGIWDPKLQQQFELLSEIEISGLVFKSKHVNCVKCDQTLCNIHILNKVQHEVLKEQVSDDLDHEQNKDKESDEAVQQMDLNIDDVRLGYQDGVSSCESSDITTRRRNEDVAPSATLQKQLNELTVFKRKGKGYKLKTVPATESKPQKHYCETNGRQPTSSKQSYIHSYISKDRNNKVIEFETGMRTRSKSLDFNHDGLVQIKVRATKTSGNNTNVSMSRKTSQEGVAMERKKPVNKPQLVAQAVNDKCSLLQEKPSSHKIVLQCNKCQRSFMRGWFLQRHKILYHSSPNMIQCTLCSASPFSSNAELLTHVKLQHRKGLWKYVCSVCEKPFCKRAELRIHHRAEHLGRTEFSCGTCPKKFKSIKVFQRHSELCKINCSISYPCTICTQSFDTKNKLERHERNSHTGEKPFECSVCRSKFAMKCDLRAHMQIHNEERTPRSQCHVCGKTFLKGYYLARHMLLHEGIKNFQCQFCGDLFVTNHSKRIHCWRKHGQPRPSRKKPLSEDSGDGITSALKIKAFVPPQPSEFQNANLHVLNKDNHEVVQDYSSHSPTVLDSSSCATALQDCIAPLSHTDSIPISTDASSTQQTIASHSTECMSFTTSSDIVCSSTPVVLRPSISDPRTQVSVTSPKLIQDTVNFLAQCSENNLQDFCGPLSVSSFPEVQFDQHNKDLTLEKMQTIGSNSSSEQRAEPEGNDFETSSFHLQYDTDDQVAFE